MTHNALKRPQIDEKTGTGMQEIKEKLRNVPAEHDSANTATGAMWVFKPPQNTSIVGKRGLPVTQSQR